MDFRRNKNHILAAAIIACGFFVFPNISQAASLSVSTDKSQYQVGDTITTRIILSSSDQAANAVSGALAFPSDKLTAKSVSKSGSIINLWVKEPSFSVSSVNFEGIILNPGYTGNGARIVSATFTAKAPGTASLYFSDGSILANDGQGTDILKGLSRASITITERTSPPPQPETPETPVGKNVPATPVITSLTNPDQTRWYNNPLVQLSWLVSSDITDISYAINKEKTTEPPSKSMGLLNAYTAQTALADGIWYFHLKLKNVNGWSQTAHYALSIDSTAPEALAVDELKKYSDVDRAKFVFDGSDSLSGIDRFEFKIDDRQPQSMSATTLHNYFEAPLLSPGQHKLSVKAIDQAANINEKTLTFYVKSRFWQTIFDFIGNNIMSFISIVISSITLIFMAVFILHERKERKKPMQKAIIKREPQKIFHAPTIKEADKSNPFVKGKIKALKKKN